MCVSCTKIFMAWLLLYEQTRLQEESQKENCIILRRKAAFSPSVFSIKAAHEWDSAAVLIREPTGPSPGSLKHGLSNLWALAWMPSSSGKCLSMYNYAAKLSCCLTCLSVPVLSLIIASLLLSVLARVCPCLCLLFIALLNHNLLCCCWCPCLCSAFTVTDNLYIMMILIFSY